MCLFPPFFRGGFALAVRRTIYGSCSGLGNALLDEIHATRTTPNETMMEETITFCYIAPYRLVEQQKRLFLKTKADGPLLRAWEPA